MFNRQGGRDMNKKVETTRDLKQRRRQISALAIAGILLFSSSVTIQSADAFWPFSKKHKDKSGKMRDRKKREITGTSVGLVAGNPPATVWKPDGTPRAAVLCLHELGLHKNVFDDFGTRMAKKGVIVYSIDLRGFGGWAERDTKDAEMDLDNTFDDVKGSLEVIRKLHSKTPVFVLGEAMGGALALEVAAKFPQLTAGIITAAPGGNHFNTVSNFTKIGGKVLTLDAGKDSHMSEELMNIATPKKDLQNAFMEDDQVRLDLKPKELMACQFYMYKTKKFAKQIKDVPVLVVHGKMDGESKEVGSLSVYKNLKTDKKKYVLLENGDHYSFEDVKVSDEAFNNALSWIDSNVPTGSVKE